MKQNRTLGIIALMILAILVTIVPSSNISQFLFIMSMPNAFAQTPGESLSNGSLQFAYTKLGVLSGTYQQILYDSNTNSLGLTNISALATAETGAGKTKITSSQDLSQSQSDKKLPDTDQTNLRQSISNNGFFQANSIYPPNPTGAQDYNLNVLSITMDNKSHTVIWTDVSSNVPAGLASIVKTIENIASK